MSQQHGVPVLPDWHPDEPTTHPPVPAAPTRVDAPRKRRDLGRWIVVAVTLVPILLVMLNNLWVMHHQRRERDFEYSYRIDHVVKPWVRYARLRLAYEARQLARRLGA